MSVFLIELNGAKVVFVHIPKTGGTSIRSGRELSSYSTRPDQSWIDLKYPSIAFVRDPLTRLVSCWKDFRYVRRHTRESFGNFVRRYSEDFNSPLIYNPRTIHHHMAPMTHPVHGLRYARFIGRTEKLRSDLDRFCDEFGVGRITLNNLRDTSAYPDPNVGSVTRSLVEVRYSEDYEFLQNVLPPYEFLHSLKGR